MRLILFATVLCTFLTVNSQKAPVSQALSEQERENLFSALETEDWEKSAELSKQYLAKLKNDDPEKARAPLRYMLLFSSAGKVTMGKMSHLGKIATVRGVVESIQYNPNQSKVWIMRVFLKDGSIVLAQ